MANVEHVIVDSGAFIRNAPVKDISDNVYTVADVVSEIKDKATRQRLQVLPYVIKFVEPDKDCLHTVTEFTKKTGDYISLSATDIRLIALTYQLEKQHVGTEHIKTVPDRKIELNSGHNGGFGTELAGFYLKNKASGGSTAKSEDAKSTGDPLSSSDIPNCDEESNGTDEMSPSGNLSTEEVNKRLPSDGDVLNEDIPEGDSSSDEVASDDDDDDEGWITPSNIGEMNKMMAGTSIGGETTSSCKVGCLTTDFAMQNVLIQMGLNVVSVDGLLIKKVRSFVLRCFSCFKISTDTSRQFCHHCGNQTLRKLTVSLNEDGTMQYFLSKKQFRIRKQPSIPLPKGGKYSNYPKLTEDQKLPQRKQARQKKQHYGVFDPDYIANSSPFALRDTTSRSAMLGAGRNFNKRDPNAGPRRRKK